MAGNFVLETLTGLIGSGDIDTVLVCFPDMQMEPVPSYHAASWDTGYGDFGVRQDMTTLRRIPWLEGTAMVLGDCVNHAGFELAYSQRAILKRQIDRARAAGLTIKMGLQLKFYIFDGSYGAASDKDYQRLETADRCIEKYHIFQATKEEFLVRAIRIGMEGAEVPVEFSKGEWGPGQAEINLRYADALEMATRHVIYKNGVKEIAWQHDKAMTFMAKFRDDLAGNSCHIHASIWDVAKGVLRCAGPAGEDGLSATFRCWVAGQLTLTNTTSFFFALSINAYKQSQVGSFASTRIAWSRDNRTAGYRLVGHEDSLWGECRFPGADCDPCLAFAALIAAGLHGIEQSLDPGPLIAGNVYDRNDLEIVPMNLHAARREQSEHDHQVTDLERHRMFERG